MSPKYWMLAIAVATFAIWRADSAAAQQPYMGHCTGDGSHPPEDVISSCKTFIDRSMNEDYGTNLIPLALYNSAIAEQLRGNSSEAKKDLQFAVRHAPSYFDAWRLLVELVTGLSGNDAAMKSVDLMIAAHPNDSHVLNTACWTRATMGLQLSSALADCNQSLSLDPGNSDTLNSRGFVEYRLADYAAAIRDDTAALAAKPNDAESLYVRGLARLKTGDAPGGNADIAAAKSLNPGIAATYAKFGVAP